MAVEQNGTRALTRLVWWAVGVGAVVIVGAGSFFATRYLQSLDERVISLTVFRDLRTERVALLEGRITTLENTSAASVASIQRSLEKMELWQEQVRQDIADLKAALRKP